VPCDTACAFIDVNTELPEAKHRKPGHPTHFVDSFRTRWRQIIDGCDGQPGAAALTKIFCNLDLLASTNGMNGVVRFWHVRHHSC
jgi:hypothetical protein